jgi:hypothetical protein
LTGRAAQRYLPSLIAASIVDKNVTAMISEGHPNAHLGTPGRHLALSSCPGTRRSVIVPHIPKKPCLKIFTVDLIAFFSLILAYHFFLRLNYDRYGHDLFVGFLSFL